MRYRIFYILATFIGLSIVASSCKTKKKSAPSASPNTDLTSDVQACSNELSLTRVEGLAPASYGELVVGKMYIEEPSLGNSEKLYISKAPGSATPDLFIYRGFKTTSKFAESKEQGVISASCLKDASNEECFTGLTYSGLNIDSNLPDGTLKIEAWACIGSQGTRVKGSQYRKVAYGDTVYLCGNTKVLRDINQHKATFELEDTQSAIDAAIKNQCQIAYHKLTSSQNLKQAAKSGNTTLQSLYGLVDMGPGKFIADCSLNLEDIVKAVAYAENKKSSSGLALANTGDDCEAEVPEEDITEYVSNSPPPTFSDPVTVIPPVAPPAPEPTPEPEPEPTPTETATAPEEPSKRELCKQRGETLAETIGGGTEWVPDVSSADKENEGTCFIVHEDGSQTQIEPSITQEPVIEEPAPAPVPSGKKGLSTAQGWGVALIVIGGIGAASGFVYNSSPAAQSTIDALANKRFPEVAGTRLSPEDAKVVRAAEVEAELDARKEVPARDGEVRVLRDRVAHKFDTEIKDLNDKQFSGTEDEIKRSVQVRDAQVAELSNRKEVVLLNNSLAETWRSMTLSVEEWQGLDGYFRAQAMGPEEVARRWTVQKSLWPVVEIASEPSKVYILESRITSSLDEVREQYKQWVANKDNAVKYIDDFNQIKAKRQEWVSSPHRRTLSGLADDHPFKQDMLESRRALDVIDDAKQPWNFFDFDSEGRMVAASADDFKPSLVAKGVAVDPVRTIPSDAKAPSDVSKAGRFSGYARAGVIGGIAVALLGTTLLGFGLTDSQAYDPSKVVEKEAIYLALLHKCRKNWESKCKEIVNNGLKVLKSRENPYSFLTGTKHINRLQPAN